jgi:STE24 endopeptidase
MGFDPAAAVAAYLATLSPAAHARATAYTQGDHWLLLWGWVVSVAVAVLIVGTDVLPRLADRLQRTRKRPVLVSLVLGLVYSLLTWLLALPWAVYADWWREKTYGLTSQSWLGWFGQGAAEAAIGAATTAVFLVGLYWIMRRAPRSWWIWAAGLFTAGSAIMLLASPVLIEPLFNRFTPAPAGAARDAVVELAKAAGVPPNRIFIYDGSRQSNRYTANVSGLMGSARVAMSDVMAKKGADLGEVRAVVAHEMGHYAHHHALWLTLGFGGLSLIGFGFAGLVYPLVARLIGAWNVQGIADPAGLPALGVIAATLTLLATPLINTATRRAEAAADRFSLVHAEEPDGLARALVKTIEYRAASPSPVEEALFYDHPSVARRIRAAMDWKAAHLAEAEISEARDAALGGSPPPAPQGGPSKGANVVAPSSPTVASPTPDTED